MLQWPRITVKETVFAFTYGKSCILLLERVETVKKRLLPLHILFAKAVIGTVTSEEGRVTTLGCLVYRLPIDLKKPLRVH